MSGVGDQNWDPGMEGGTLMLWSWHCWEQLQPIPIIFSTIACSSTKNKLCCMLWVGEAIMRHRSGKGKYVPLSLSKLLDHQQGELAALLAGAGPRREFAMEFAKEEQ